MEQIYWYCLAHAANKHGIEIHACVMMSNHHHTDVTDTLGELIANWTGLTTEGLVTMPPFLTDDDWGGNVGNGVIDFVVDQDPWLADDDTDIEYVYAHLLDLNQDPEHNEVAGAGLAKTANAARAPPLR